MGASACRGVASRCVRFQCPRDRRGSNDGVSRPSDGDARNSWSDTVRSQGPTARRCTKGGVSGPAEDLRPVPEVEAGVNFRPAGRVWGQVAGSLPERQPGWLWDQDRQGKCAHTFPPPGGSWFFACVTWTRQENQAIDGLDEGV